MGLGRAIGDWVKRRHPRIAAWPWHEISGCGLACLIGTAIMLISVFDPRDDAFPAGRPVVFAAGMVFFVAGLAILSPALVRGRHATALQGAFGATLLTGFAAIPVMLVLGGDRALPWLASIAVLGVLVLVAWSRVLQRLIPRRAARLWLYAGLAIGITGAAAAVRSRLPGAGHEPAQAGPVFEPVTLTLERGTVAPGDVVYMTFDRPITMPRGYGYWVCIVPAGAPVHSQGLWAYLVPGVTSAELEAPKTPGEYEVRLHPHMNAVLASRPLLVSAAAPPRVRPDVEAH